MRGVVRLASVGLVVLLASMAPQASASLVLSNEAIPVGWAAPDGVVSGTDLIFGAGSDIRFEPTAVTRPDLSTLTEITLRASNSVSILGAVDAGPYNLRIETPGSIRIEGSVTAPNLTLSAGEVFLESSSVINVQGGTLRLSSADSVALRPGSGGTVTVSAGSTLSSRHDSSLLTLFELGVNGSSYGGTLTFSAGPSPASGGSIEVSPPEPIPVPAAAWLFGSGLMGLLGLARRCFR